MNKLKRSTEIILEKLVETRPDTTQFRTAEIKAAAAELGYTGKDWVPLVQAEFRISNGIYDFAGIIKPLEPEVLTNVARMGPASVVNDKRNFAAIDNTFVPWGPFTDIVKVIKSEMFYPVYISGMSGNGKTFSVEQACAKESRELVRVQINPETDEDDLIGGFRLVDGETVFAKGPVLKAMENGAILLLDEIDRATNKIMCLQGILEGKPVLVKKTGEIVEPTLGFNVIATANTKGTGSEDGRYTAASIIDEAFLERFTISVDQKFASPAIEKRILNKHFDKFGMDHKEAVNKDFNKNLVAWADIIRKTFYDDGVDEVISTRRLCHIVQTFSIFKNKMKAIELCIARFDDDTKLAFLDLYSKVDAGVTFNEDGSEVSTETPDIEIEDDE